MRRLTGAELRPQARRHLSFRPSAVASHTKTPPQVKPAGFSSKKYIRRPLPAGCGRPDAVHSIGAAIFRALCADQVGSRHHGGFGLVSRPGLHTKGHMWCRCASRLTDTAYSPDYQIFGRERRQCKVVRRDALHAPTPRSALPWLQPGRVSRRCMAVSIPRRRGGRGYRRGAVCRVGFRSGWLCGRCCRRDCSLSRLWLCIRRYRWARTIQESGVCR